MRVDHIYMYMHKYIIDPFNHFFTRHPTKRSGGRHTHSVHAHAGILPALVASSLRLVTATLKKSLPCMHDPPTPRPLTCTTHATQACDDGKTQATELFHFERNSQAFSHFERNSHAPSGHRVKGGPSVHDASDHTNGSAASGLAAAASAAR